METKSQRPKGPDDAFSLLNAAIDTLNLTRNTTNVEQAKDAFGSASLLLTTIRVRFLFSLCLLITDRCTQDSMIKETDCVELGLSCAETCQVLYREINGRRQEQLSQSLLESIERLKS